MTYTYDGSFEGLLTIMFDKYCEIEDISIVGVDSQINFFSVEEIKTDLNKFERVKKSIISTFSYDFFLDLYYLHFSKDSKKEEVILKTVKKMYKNGYKFLNGADEYAVRFNKMLKNLIGEVHLFKGLLRFRKIQNDFWIAEFEPENDILNMLSEHFVKRMPKESFIICDKLRNKCFIYSEGKFEILDIVNLIVKEDDEEKYFKETWKLFYETVAIKERKNEKLMKSNMAMKRWKYLTEKN